MHAKALALLLALFLLPLIRPVHANVIAPTIYEQDDMGDPVLLQDFTYSLSVDCTAATISIIAMDGHNRPVEGVYTYLKYVDFSTPLMAQGMTDKDGFVLHKLPGSTRLMRGLFVLVLEKRGFRNKEIHFDISGCYSNGTTAKPKPPANGTAPANNSNATRPPANGSQPANNSGWPPFNYTYPPAAGTTNTSAVNQSRDASAPLAESVAKAWPFALTAIALLISAIAIFKYFRPGKSSRAEHKRHAFRRGMSGTSQRSRACSRSGRRP